jgi:hypothetical protein
VPTTGVVMDVRSVSPRVVIGAGRRGMGGKSGCAVGRVEEGARVWEYEVAMERGGGRENKKIRRPGCGAAIN